MIKRSHGRVKFAQQESLNRIEAFTMAAHNDDSSSALENFLSGPSLEPDSLGEPPLKDGKDPLLTRERVMLDGDDE